LDSAVHNRIKALQLPACNEGGRRAVVAELTSLQVLQAAPARAQNNKPPNKNTSIFKFSSLPFSLPPDLVSKTIRSNY
jgi:hypothetical protein